MRWFVKGRYLWQKVIYLVLICGYSSNLVQCLAQTEIIYLLMVYLIMLSAAQMRIWLLKCYGHRRKWSRPNFRYCTILAFGWIEWGKPQQAVRIVLIKSEMCTSKILVTNIIDWANLLSKESELWCHTQESFCVLFAKLQLHPTI
jgi:hypothetical protein